MNKEFEDVKVIDFEELYNNNLFMHNIKGIEAVCKEHDVDTLIGLSIWYKDYEEKLDPKEYTKQVKDFTHACIAVGYDFENIYNKIFRKEA